MEYLFCENHTFCSEIAIIVLHSSVAFCPNANFFLLAWSVSRETCFSRSAELSLVCIT